MYLLVHTLEEIKKLKRVDSMTDHKVEAFTILKFNSRFKAPTKINIKGLQFTIRDSQPFDVMTLPPRS